MQCLILAGGLGTRMQHLGGDVPKALIPVNGRPFADYQLQWLADQGVRRVVYAIGYKGDLIRQFVGNGERWGLQIRYADEGEKLLGTAGAIRRAIAAGLMDDGFFVLYGDSYLTIDLNSLDISDPRAGGDDLDIDDTAWADENDASASATEINTALGVVDTFLAEVSGNLSEIESHTRMTDSLVENYSAAKSALVEVDAADELVNYTSLDVQTQAAAAMLSQANLTQNYVLRLYDFDFG